MRFLSKGQPPFSRVLLIESGSRHLYEDLLGNLYDFYPDMKADLVTCYAGAPENFQADRGLVYRVTDYPDSQSRKRFYEELARNHYTVAGVICSAEPIMTKWKWMLAARVPAKMFVLNENGDLFWAQWSEWRTIRHFALFRAGLSGSGAAQTIWRLLLFPFALCYLCLYAATVHLRRRIRLMTNEGLK